MKRIGMFVLMLVLAGAFLYYVGDLSLRSCLAIVFLVAVSWPWAQKEVTPTFEPHELRLQPRIGLMLIDVGLTTDEGWRSLVGSPPPRVPWTSLDIIHYGLNAVVLSANENGEYVVHWNVGTYSNNYTSNLATSVRLDFLKLPGRSQNGWSPDFYMRPGRGGYELGLVVWEEWWKANEEKLANSGVVKSHDREWQYGTVRLILETLPYSVFWLYHQGWSQKLVDDIKADVAKSGWEQKDMGNAEIGYMGEMYVSKYADAWLMSLPKGY